MFSLICAVCAARATIVGVTNGSVVNSDTVISCASDNNTYPPATYKWTNDVDGFQWIGSIFPLKVGAQYKLTCNASNNFHEDGCYATDYVEFHSKLPLLIIITIYFHRFEH